MRATRLALLAATLTLLVGCGRAMDGDEFRVEAVGLADVTTVLTHRWTVSSAGARVRHATLAESGRARLVVRDADGQVVYDLDLQPNLDSPTLAGAAGTWRVQVILTDFSGTLDFTLAEAGSAYLAWLRGWRLLLLVFVLFCGIMFVAYRTLVAKPREAAAEERSIGFARELAMLGLTGASVLAVLMAALYAVPIGENTRSALIGLIGLLLTALLTLSSTTLVANIIAGFMLRAVRPFRRGDWVRVGEQFGRVTERGAVNTTLQTEDRDYATIPNLYLITHPLTVIRRSGTYVAATVSLGYDHHHGEIEELLERAALTSGLKEPFEVRILDLGDHAVTYRVAGMLPEDSKMLLVAESKLRQSILDVLHGAGIEIVSPSFMNQRQVGEQSHFVPTGGAVFPAPRPDEAVDVIFDEAQRAGQEELSGELATLNEDIAEAEARRGTLEGEELAELNAALEGMRERRDELAKLEAAETGSTTSDAGAEPARSD